MPFIVLAVALGLVGLAIGFALMLAVIVIVGGGIGLIAYSLYLQNAPDGLALPKGIPYLEYWALGIGASLIMLILGIELFYGVGVFYDKAYMASVSSTQMRWYFVWYVLGHIIFGCGLLASAGYLISQFESGTPSWPPPPDKIIYYYASFIGASSGAVFIFVQWPRLSTFGTIFIILPIAFYNSTKWSIQQQKIETSQAARNARIEELRQGLAQLSEDDFVKNVIR